ncbi:MAG: hypothetical protein K8R79_03715 [Calditrichales bacterium]|nr:hypothetical protein [Calditrichales bacterium]
MELLTERYEEKIQGILSCYDRVVIQGTLPEWCYADGMTSYLYANQIRIFDYPKFAEPLRDEIRNNAEKVAEENDLKIEFIRKPKSFRKEARIKEILEDRGSHSGLIHIFSAMESCASYKPWHDKETGRTFLKYDTAKCLHYYFYFIDKDYGLCYMRVPTWCPFRLQFYFNGHNWLASKLENNNIDYDMHDNAFLDISDFEKAQDLSDKIRIEDLHNVLNILANRYCPVINKFGLLYRWTVMQVEYATDIIFKKQSDLQAIYDNLVRTAIHSVKPEDIASFLGQKLHFNYKGEMGNRFNVRILGTRIKHQMGEANIKMYDKFGIILRIETTSNNISKFKMNRKVRHRDGTKEVKLAQMPKSIYSLYHLIKLLKASNRRYLEFISSFNDTSDGMKILKKLSRTIKSKNRNFKGFNLFNLQELHLFDILIRGELNIKGFQNKTLRKYFPGKSSGAISYIIKRLRVHGIIKKVGKTYKYYLTNLGKEIIVAGLRLREMFLIPELAKI